MSSFLPSPPAVMTHVFLGCHAQEFCKYFGLGHAAYPIGLIPCVFRDSVWSAVRRSPRRPRGIDARRGSRARQDLRRERESTRFASPRSDLPDWGTSRFPRVHFELQSLCSVG